MKCTRISKIFVLNDLSDSWWPTENGKKNEKANFLFLFPFAYFGCLYTVYEARASCEFIRILKYSIKDTRISKIFVLSDQSDSWWPTKKGKKLWKNTIFR